MRPGVLVVAQASRWWSLKKVEHRRQVLIVQSGKEENAIDKTTEYD